MDGSILLKKQTNAISPFIKNKIFFLGKGVWCFAVYFYPVLNLSTTSWIPIEQSNTTIHKTSSIIYYYSILNNSTSNTNTEFLGILPVEREP